MSSGKIPYPRQNQFYLRWTRSSYYLMSAFIAIILLIIVIWWPLVVDYAAYFDPRLPIWRQMDWLLLGIFSAMSLLIMAGADFRSDAAIVLVGLIGGLVIESWGTRTGLWTYFTFERPPLWILPAWPIASLSTDRLARFLLWRTKGFGDGILRKFYWLSMALFCGLMVIFVRPTIAQPYTIFTLLLCAWLIFLPGDYRQALLIFGAGAGLGYFLERWGTTRACWTYYTGETPPLFAVLAHGMASFAFWRTRTILVALLRRWRRLINRDGFEMDRTPI